MQEAIFGGGCFWCLEAAFEGIDGVIDVESGYANGFIKNPTYEDVCSGKSGFTEVVKIKFDEKKISYRDLLKIFFKIHDPTTLNRQGNDIGFQYRSLIIPLNQEQLKEAKEYIKEISPLFKNRIVTKIEPFKNYYRAEEYHQDYFRKNPNRAYCKFVVYPKVLKAKEAFREIKGSKN